MSDRILDPSWQRRIVTPTPLEKQEIERLRRRRVLDDIALKVLDGSSVIHDNQRLSAARICAELVSLQTLFVLLVAQTQSGKTGTMVALIKQYLLHQDNYTPVKNIIVITGLSSIDWWRQTRERIPDGIRVLHRNKLNDDFAEELSQMRNVLIIFDEVHIACKKTQTLTKLFHKAGFHSVESLLERDIKCVEFCATPDGVLYNLSNKSWGKHTKIIKSDPGVGYTSIFDLYDQGRVYQSEDLCGFDVEYPKNNNTFPTISLDRIKKETIEHIEQLKQQINNFNSCKYHLFRIPGGDLQINSNLRHIFGSDNYSYLTYDQQSDISDLNEVLSKEPKRHTFILIKEKLRCAVTLTKTYLGILYERFALNPSDSVNIQGFAGRITGYDTNSDSIIYTNISSILQYRQQWETDFKDNTISWISNTTYFNKRHNITIGKQTFNHATLFMQNISDSRKERYMVFNNFSELRNDFRNHFNNLPENVRGPQKRKVITSDLSTHKGFYDAKIKGTRKVWSENEIIIPSTWRGAANNVYWMYPCYTDVNNIDTLKWYLISKELKPELSEIFEEKK